MRRDFPPSGNGVETPSLVVFKVINLKPLKGEVPWGRLHEPSFEVNPFASASVATVGDFKGLGLILA